MIEAFKKTLNVYDGFDLAIEWLDTESELKRMILDCLEAYL